MDNNCKLVCNCDSNKSVNKTKKTCGILEDEILDLQHELEQVKRNLKNKECLIKMQSEQLKKMEEMHKKALDDNKSLNYTRRKALNDLENLRIILKGYEKGKRCKKDIGCGTYNDRRNSEVEHKESFETMLKQQQATLGAIFAMCVYTAHSHSNDDAVSLLRTDISALKDLIQSVKPQNMDTDVVNLLRIELIALKDIIQSGRPENSTYSSSTNRSSCEDSDDNSKRRDNDSIDSEIRQRNDLALMKKCLEAAPARKCLEPAPVRKCLEPAPVRNCLNAAPPPPPPVRNCLEPPAPARKCLETVPVKKCIETVLVRKCLENVTARSCLETVSANTCLEADICSFRAMNARISKTCADCSEPGSSELRYLAESCKIRCKPETRCREKSTRCDYEEHVSLLEEENQLLRQSLDKLKLNCEESKLRLTCAETKMSEYESKVDLKIRENESLQKELMAMKSQLSRLIGNLESEMSGAKRYYFEDAATDSNLEHENLTKFLESKVKLAQKVEALMNSEEVVRKAVTEEIQAVLRVVDRGDVPEIDSESVTRQMKIFCEYIKKRIETRARETDADKGMKPDDENNGGDQVKPPPLQKTVSRVECDNSEKEDVDRKKLKDTEDLKECESEQIENASSSQDSSSAAANEEVPEEDEEEEEEGNNLLSEVDDLTAPTELLQQKESFIKLELSSQLCRYKASVNIFTEEMNDLLFSIDNSEPTDFLDGDRLRTAFLNIKACIRRPVDSQTNLMRSELNMVKEICAKCFRDILEAADSSDQVVGNVLGIFSEQRDLKDQLIKAFLRLRKEMVGYKRLRNSDPTIENYKKQSETDSKTIQLLRAQLSDKSSHHRLLNTDDYLECSKRECDNLRENVKRLKDNITVATSLRNKYYELMDMYNKQNAELIRQNVFMKENIGVMENYKTQLAESQAQVAELEGQINSLTQNHEQLMRSEIEILTQNHEEELVKTRLGARMEILTQNQEELKNLRLEAARHHEKYVQVALEKEELQNEFDCYKGTRPDMTDDDIKRIVSECDKYKANLDHLNGRIAKYILEQTNYEKEKELLTQRLMDENARLKERMMSSPQCSADFPMAIGTTVEEQIRSVDLYIKYREEMIENLSGERAAARRLMEELVEKYERRKVVESGGVSELPEMTSRVTVDTFASSFSRQDQEYINTKMEIASNELYLSSKLKDVEIKKTRLQLSLQNIRSETMVEYPRPGTQNERH